MKRALGPLVVLSLIFAAVSPALGQVIVNVLEDETGDPVVGAAVHLVAADGSTQRRALTNDRGAALLVGFADGRYRLRVEMIGMATVETDLFHAVQGETLQREVRLERRFLPLEGLDVEVEGRCRVRPEGVVTAQVWEEARKALEGSTATAAAETYRYRTMLYERDLELGTKRILSERTSVRHATMRTPFRSRSAEELAEYGYVEESGKVDLYFAPDAGVLLSDAFLDAHCFRLRVDPSSLESDSVIGLSFEPLDVEGRRVDVSGTLWLDRGTSELKWLQFHYENLPPELRSSEVGGRVEFRRMPDGTWIVPRWWIRMPNAAVRTNFLSGRPERAIASLRETGGVVLDVERADAAARVTGRPMAATGTIGGVVRDSAGVPARGIEVEIGGVGRTAVTDSAGRFEFSGLLEGIYDVRIRHPELEALGWVPISSTLNVFDGDDLWLDLGLPSARQVVRESCPAAEAVDTHDVPSGNGTVFGRVVAGGTGDPIPGVRVRIHSSRYELSPVGVHERAYGVEVVTDEVGLYRICGAPEGELLRITALHVDREIDVGTVRITDAGGLVRRDIDLPPSR